MQTIYFTKIGTSGRKIMVRPLLVYKLPCSGLHGLRVSSLSSSVKSYQIGEQNAVLLRLEVQV